jgi:transposase
MARISSGKEHIVLAQASLKAARSADELRIAQSVLLPLELGLTLEQTAKAIGRSVGATCKMRVNFCEVAKGVRQAAQPKTSLRNRAKASLEREAQVLDTVLANANDGGVVVTPRLKGLIEKELGKTMALASVYRMLHRHNWRKLAPDTQHPKGDPQAREVWKKNYPI